MAISSPGVGSGLDVQSLVAQLVAAERTPKTLRLDRQEAGYQAKISALGSLKGSLSGLQGSLSDLLKISSYDKRSASSSNTDLITVSASSSAVASNYSISVEALAQSHKLDSGAYSDISSSITGGAGGTLTFQFGTYSGGSFTVNPDKSTKTVTIDSADSSLDGIRDAINAADIGVRANIINDGSGHHLVLVGEDSGAANSIKLTVEDDDGNDLDAAGLSKLAYDPEGSAGNGKNITQLEVAQDASLLIDTIAVTSATNTVTTAIEGVTLNLVAASPGTKVNVAVSQDTSSTKSSIEGFVTAYNKLIDNVNNLSFYNTDSGEAGVLIGDSTLRTVSGQIRSIISDVVTGLAGDYRALSDLGITTDNNGKLQIDSTKLDNAIRADADTVARVFAGAAYIADSDVIPADLGSAAIIGDYSLNITQLATKGVYQGGAISAFPPDLTIDSNNDTFVIKVDGVSSGTIALTNGTYTTASSLAAEIQSRINGDSTLDSANLAVTVSYNTGANRFEITSNKFGSESTVELVSVDTNSATSLGFDLSGGVGSSTAGVDVAGTIGGVAATGSGQTLTGIGNAAGIILNITGGSTGNRGTVTVTRGIADQLNTILDSYLDSEGIFDSRTEILNNQIEDIQDARESLGLRMAALEQRLMRQFSALDALVAQLQTTSNYLSQQLATLPTVSTNQ